MSEISSKTLLTAVAVPSSHNASYAVKKDVADFLHAFCKQLLFPAWINLWMDMLMLHSNNNLYSQNKGTLTKTAIHDWSVASTADKKQ